MTCHVDPQGEKMFSSTLSLTSALDGGGWSTPRSGRFNPGKDAVEAGWAPGPVWTEEKNTQINRDSISGTSSP